MANTQVNFAGGLNAGVAPHLIGDNEVQAATNVDFSLEWGGLVCRRATATIGTFSEPLNQIQRNYTAASIDSSPWYGAGTAQFKRGTMTTGTVTFGSIGAVASGTPLLTHYQNYEYMAAGSKAYKDDGTNTWLWLMDTPATAPTTIVTGNIGTTSGVVDVTGFTALLTAIDGTVTASSTTTDSNRYPYPTFIMTTATTGTGTTISLSGTCTLTNWDVSYVTPFNYSGLNTNSSIVYTNTIGPYGIDTIFIALSNPAAVTKISRDVSIGDATFSNYWHTEIGIKELENTVPDITSMGVANQLSQDIINNLKQTFTTARRGAQLRGAVSYFGNTAGFVHVWPVARTDYGFVGNINNPDWTNIKAVRIIIEAFDTTQVIVGGWQTSGSLLYSLLDTQIGYKYYQTIARVEGGVVVFEGPPSPASVATKVFNNGIYVTGAAYTGSATSGGNYYGLYRQGGLLTEPHLIDYYPVASVGSAIFDGGYPDLSIVDNPVLTQNIQGTWTSANAISESWNGRIFLGVNNNLRWSLPGQPSIIPLDSEVDVSDLGDKIKGLVVWDRLIIVNQQSVFEMDGSIFEGDNQDWIVKRSGSRRGSVAPNSIIKTPYGILLLGYDGVSLYTPGYGVDQPLDWVTDKIGDAWKGTAATDPVALKGNRVPAIDFNYIQNCSAAYANGKIYLAIPTTTSTAGAPNAIFVLDITHKDVWVHTYSFGINSLYWDQVNNRLVAGTSSGLLTLLENGTPISNDTWSAKTRAWTTNQDMVLENLSVESQPQGNVQVKAIVDGTTTLTLGTLTGTTRGWTPLSLTGTIGNNVVFNFAGTNTASANGAVYGLSWDAKTQPNKVTFARSEFDNGGVNHQKIWDVHYDELEGVGTGTITSVTYVDNTATLTNTIVSPTNGKVLSALAFADETYGNIAYTTYTGPQFKLWRTANETREEPTPVTTFVSDRHTNNDGVQKIWDVHFDEVNVLGTGTLTMVTYVDNTVVMTNTIAGPTVGRVLLANAYPAETYGYISYTNYTGPLFKRYKTYDASRVEPAPISVYVTDRYSIKSNGSDATIEAWWHNVQTEINPLGNTILGTVYLDNTIVSTFTYTGGSRGAFNFDLPSETYGDVIYVKYVANSGNFKHYDTRYKFDLEPSRDTFNESAYDVMPSEGYVKTWLSELNPQGGSVVGTALVDGIVVMTATFIGTLRHVFEIGLPNITTGKSIKAQYTSTTPFKRYSTRWETSAKPFGKKTWVVNYFRPQGASQLGMARFHTTDLEVVGTATVTSTWLSDNSVILTNTNTLSAGRNVFDQVSFPSGMRGYLFSQQITSDSDFKLWRSNIDFENITVKGLVRNTIDGTPQDKEG